MQQLPENLQNTQRQRFYQEELEELAQIRDALRAKHRPGADNSGSDYDSLSDRDAHDDDRDDHAEAADMDTHIPSSNLGYKLLLKMGWKAGTGLGQSATGRTAPIPIERKQDMLGIGKQEVDTWYNESSTAKRKATEVERQAEETEADRIRREKQVEQQKAVQAELGMIKSAFYCALCDKQYERISDYEVHLSSYDHNHKKRFKEMKDTSRAGAASTTNKIKEKERKREERELAKMQEAALKRAGGMGNSNPQTPQRPVQGTTPTVLSESSDFKPTKLGGFQPVQSSGFQPVQSSGFQPVQSSGFQPVQSSDFQSVQSSGFQPVQSSGFQPAHTGSRPDTPQVPNGVTQQKSEGDGSAAPAAGSSGFQPVKLGGFKPMKMGGFQLKKPGSK